MASTFRLFRNLKSKFRSISGSVIYPNTRNILRIPTSILFMSSAISFKDGKESDGLQAADMESLTTSSLLKNASLECINSASALLTHTASNLIELERHYTQSLHTLRRLFEISLGDLDDESRQLAFWDAVMEIRHEIARLKKERNDMESMFYSAERMLNAAAEAALVAAISFKDGKESDGLQAADMESLTTSSLLKNASLECINSASALLTHTASNLIELERHYTQSLHTLRRLFEISLGDLDDESRQLAFWDAVMEIRHEIARLKKERNDMESMFYSAERMLNAAAEAALVAGANYASTVAGERIFSAQCQLRALQQARIETEAILGQSEAEYIHAFSEHKKNKKAEQKQAEIEEEFEDKREAYFDDNYENNEKSFEDTRDAYFDDNYVKSHEFKVKSVVTDTNNMDNLPEDIPFGLTEETFKEEDNFASRDD